MIKIPLITSNDDKDIQKALKEVKCEIYCLFMSLFCTVSNDVEI